MFRYDTIIYAVGGELDAAWGVGRLEVLLRPEAAGLAAREPPMNAPGQTGSITPDR
jgi:hypothetical protein